MRRQVYGCVLLFSLLGLLGCAPNAPIGNTYALQSPFALFEIHFDERSGGQYTILRAGDDGRPFIDVYKFTLMGQGEPFEIDLTKGRAKCGSFHVLARSRNLQLISAGAHFEFNRMSDAQLNRIATDLSKQLAFMGTAGYREILKVRAGPLWLSCR